jgi:hypothetical protein
MLMLILNADDAVQGVPVRRGLDAIRWRSRTAAHVLRRYSAPKAKPQWSYSTGVLGNKCLTMTYFHRRTSTIIGAKAFHVPVRDGKEWGHLAMVVKRKGLLSRLYGATEPIGVEAPWHTAWKGRPIRAVRVRASRPMPFDSVCQRVIVCIRFVLRFI